MTGRHRKREVSDKVGGLMRQMDAHAFDIAADPVALAHAYALVGRMTDAINMGIYLANTGSAHYSLGEMAKILGMARNNVLKRVRLGEQVYNRYLERKEFGLPQVSILETRMVRAAALRAAGLPDRTGSDKERAAPVQ